MRSQPFLRSSSRSSPSPCSLDRTFANGSRWGRVGLLVGYVAVADAAQSRYAARRTARSLELVGSAHVHFHFAYGAYVGVGAGIAALIGAGWLRREQLFVRASPWTFVEVTIAIALLAVLLLPWTRSGLPPALRESYLGIESPAGVIAALLAVQLAASCWKDVASSSLEQVLLAGGVLVFTGAAFAASFATVHDSWAWPGLAVAAALLLVVASGTRQWRVTRLSTAPALSAIASIGVVASLFLPWQTACYGQSASLKALGLSGRCGSTNGFDVIGATAATVSFALAVMALTPRFRRISMLELATGLALLVATLGFRLENGTLNGARFGFGYGSFTGFVAAGLVVLLAVGTGRSRPGFPRLGARAVAIVLCLFYVAAVVTPWWGVLPNRVWTIFPLHGLGVSWLTVAAALLGVRLLADWLQESPARSDEVLLLPLALAALTVLGLVPFPHVHLNRSSGLLLGLAFALAILGLVDRRGGIRSLSVPEILRVDRI